MLIGRTVVIISQCICVSDTLYTLNIYNFYLSLPTCMGLWRRKGTWPYSGDGVTEVRSSDTMASGLIHLLEADVKGEWWRLTHTEIWKNTLKLEWTEVGSWSELQCGAGLSLLGHRVTLVQWVCPLSVLELRHCWKQTSVCCSFEFSVVSSSCHVLMLKFLETQVGPPLPACVSLSPLWFCCCLRYRQIL